MSVPTKQMALQLAEAVTPPSEVLINADMTSKLNPTSEFRYYYEWSKPDFLQTIQDNPNLLMNMRGEALKFYLAHQTDFPGLKMIIDSNTRHFAPLLENLAKDTKNDLLLLSHPRLIGELSCSTFTQLFKRYYNNYTLLPIFRSDQDKKYHTAVLHSLIDHLNCEGNHACQLLLDLSGIASEILIQFGNNIAENPAKYVSLFKLISPKTFCRLLHKLAEDGKKDHEKNIQYQQLATSLLANPFLAVRQLIYNGEKEAFLQLYDLLSTDNERSRPKLPISEALLESHLRSLSCSDIEIITEGKPANYLEILNLLLSLSNQELLKKHQGWLLPHVIPDYAEVIVRQALIRYKVVTTAIGGELYGRAVLAILANLARFHSYSDTSDKTSMIRELNPTWLRQQTLPPVFFLLIEETRVISEWLDAALNGNNDMAKLFCAYPQLLASEFDRVMNDHYYKQNKKQMCSKIEDLFKILHDIRNQELKDHPNETVRINLEYQLRNFELINEDHQIRTFLSCFPKLITWVSPNGILLLLLREIAKYPVAYTSLDSRIRDLLSENPSVRENILHTQNDFELVETWPELANNLNLPVFQQFLQRCASSHKRDEIPLIELWRKPALVKIFTNNPRLLSALSLDNIMDSCLKNSGILADVAKIAPPELRSSMILHSNGEALLDQDITLLSGKSEATCKSESNEPQTTEAANTTHHKLQSRIKLPSKNESILDLDATQHSGMSEDAGNPKNNESQTAEDANATLPVLQPRLKLHPESEALLDQEITVCSGISEEALNKIISSGKYTTEKNIPYFKTLLKSSPRLLYFFPLSVLINTCVQYPWLVTLISEPSLSTLRSEIAAHAEGAGLFISYPHWLIAISKTALVNLVNIHGVKLLKAALTVQSPVEIPVETFISFVEVNHEFAYLCMRSKKIKETDKHHFITMLNNAADTEHLPSLYECGRSYYETKQYRSAADRLIAYVEIMGPTNSSENNALAMLAECAAKLVNEDIALGLSYYCVALQMMSNTRMVDQVRPKLLSLPGCADTREDREKLRQKKDFIEIGLQLRFGNASVVSKLIQLQAPYHPRSTYRSSNNFMNNILDRYLQIALVNKAFIERQQFYYNSVASLYLILTRIDFTTLISSNLMQTTTSTANEYFIMIIEMYCVLDQITSSPDLSLASKARSSLNNVMSLAKTIFGADQIMKALDDQQTADTVSEKKFKRQPLSQSPSSQDRISEKLFCNERANFLDAYANRDELVIDKATKIMMTGQETQDEQALRKLSCQNLKITACTQMANIVRDENNNKVHKIILPMISPSPEKQSLQSYLHAKIVSFAPKIFEHLEQAEKVRPEHELAIKDQTEPTGFPHHIQNNTHYAELNKLKCLTIVGLFKQTTTNNSAATVIKHAKTPLCNAVCKHFEQGELQTDFPQPHLHNQTRQEVINIVR